MPTPSYIREFVEDLVAGQNDEVADRVLTKRDKRFISLMSDKLEDGEELSNEEIVQVEEVWKRLA